MAGGFIDIRSFFSFRGLPYPLPPLKKDGGQAGELLDYNDPLKKDGGQAGELLDYNDPLIKQEIERIERDVLGRPIFMPIYLNAFFLENAQITITGKKNIVSTTPLARQGSVNEIVNSDNYGITIKGVFINRDSKEYPFAKIKNINELFKLKESLKITCELTNNLGIEYVIIESISIPAVNRQNIAVYELNCISDSDYDLIVE